jgi:phenylacetate-CoA ligase
MNADYDDLETRDPAVREAALLAALPAHVAQAQRTTAWARSSPASMRPRPPRAPRWPAAAGDAQARTAGAPAGRARPAATLSAASRHRLERAAHAAGARVYQSPGPIYEPEGEASRLLAHRRALCCRRFRAGDLVHNSFSYHLTPAGSMMETGAHAIGCTVFPGGVGNTELQLQAMANCARRPTPARPASCASLEKADEWASRCPR